MPSRRLIASVPLILAVPGAAHAQGIVPGESKIRDNGIGKAVTGGGYATKRGVEVGDRVRKVRRRYPRLTSRPELGGRAPWALQQECA